MNIPANLFLDGLQFVQFANAAEDLADAEKAAGTGSSANDMAEAAEHMKEAFSEMQHLAYLLHVTNKADAAPNTACFQVRCRHFLVRKAVCHFSNYRLSPSNESQIQVLATMSSFLYMQTPCRTHSGL